MIYSISADKATFNTVEFTPGFNLILAERTIESTGKDSRNGLGKSTLIEIIHFCLGGNKGETLSKPEMDDWTFTIDIDIANKRFNVSRNTSTKKQSKVVVVGDKSEWPIQPVYDKNLETLAFSKNDWNKLLGLFLFNLPLDNNDFKYQPTFRSLISYFIRKDGHSGAFLSPFQHFKKQQEWDMQISNAFLLGLDWEFSSKLQVLKDRKKLIDQIKIEAQSGILSNLIGSIGELEALMIRLDAQVKLEDEEMSSFNIHPQYSKIELEVNALTEKIHALSNEDVTDKNLLDHYTKSLADEIDANPNSVATMYNEAGLFFSENITKKIEDVLAFHKQVIINRKEFLKTEIDRLKQIINQRNDEKLSLSNRRSELMLILNSHGALEEYTKLQNLHQKTVGDLHNIKSKIESLKRFEQGKSSLAIDVEILFQEAKIELSERQKQKEKAILFFNANSKNLYDAPGTLSIDIEKTGFKFGVNIERSGSHGIGNMKIFCYDLMLAQLWSSKNPNPNVLFHDSILFADVDERQKAHAIELAAKEAERLGFQYICTLNSDSIPSSDFSKDFIISKYIRKIFTDATENGGLLGIRF